MSPPGEAPARSAVCAIDARVAALRVVCREHVFIELVAPGFPPSHPGQFLQLRCRADMDAPDRVLEWREGAFPQVTSAEFDHREPFTRRPFSIADRWTDQQANTRLAVISRAVGVGTRWLETLRAGGTLNITGPLGHGFEIPDDRTTPLVLIGGGVGIPPLLYLARVLHTRGHEDVTLILGVRSHDLLPLELTAATDRDGRPSACVRLPGDAPYPAVITSDDGSLGMRGFATEALRGWLAWRGVAAGRALALACGPEAMLRSIAVATRRAGLAAQLCIERNMGCGLGTCLSCVVKVRDASRPAGWRWALACSDGPVFDRDALLDYV